MDPTAIENQTEGGIIDDTNKVIETETQDVFVVLEKATENETRYIIVVKNLFFIFCDMSATSLGDRTVVHMCIHTTTAIAAVTKPKRLRKPYSCAQPERWLRGGTPESLHLLFLLTCIVVV